MKFAVEVGICVRGAEGFSSCGDAAFAVIEREYALFGLVDALGHGPDAQISAERASQVMQRSADKGLGDVLMLCDEALRGVRGAVISAARMDDRGVSFAGIGNVEILGPPGVSRPVVSPGIVGRGIRRPREFTLPVEAGHRWLLVSDGIRARSLRTAVDDAQHLDAQRAAEQILGNARRPDDDASVLVIDFRSGSAS